MIPRFNKTILACVLLLSGMGLLCLWMQAPTTDLTGHSIKESIFLKQVTFLGIALTTMGLVAWPHYLNYRLLAFAAYLVLLGLLALLLVKGQVVNGARCWFNVGPIKFQPAEFMKIALVLVLANVLMYGRDVQSWRGILLPLALTAVPAGLIVVQPDMGMTIILIPTVFAMLFTAGARKRHLAVLVALLLVALPLVWMKGMKEYQRNRILAFLHGDSYQVTQSVKACIAGGALGRGLGEGASNPLYFIPERHTDFVYSIVAEDLGFAGCSFVILLLAIYFTTSLKIAHASREPFGRLLVVGLTTVMATQTFINLGMTLGVAPVTGLTLPFVSYGGSSLVVCSISAGLILNVAARWQPGFSSRDMAGSVEIRDLQPKSVVGVGQ
jgi:rod shape determining protein RodA